jgi:hypothetical protein
MIKKRFKPLKRKRISEKQLFIGFFLSFFTFGIGLYPTLIPYLQSPIKIDKNISISAPIIPRSAANTTIFTDNFESGTAKWRVVDGLWHLTDSTSSLTNPYRSYEHAMWFGQESTDNFNTGNREIGNITTIPFSLSGETLAYFEFYHHYHGEGGTYDKIYVKVSTDNTNWFTIYANTASTINAWEQIILPLHEFCGNSSVRISFMFDTIDSVANSGIGWLVDDVVVFTELSLPSLATPIISTITPNPDRDGIISLGWNSITDATSYWIYRETTNITSLSGLTPISVVTGTGFTEPSSLTNATYYYAVLATNGLQNSTHSHCENVTVAHGVPDSPDLNDITPDPDLDGNIYLTWPAIPDISYYSIYRETTNITSLGGLSAITTTTSTSYFDYNLANGTYYYSVVGSNSFGQGNITDCENVTVAIPLWIYNNDNETNNDFAAANPLIPGPMGGHLGPTDTTDYYQFNADTTGDIVVAVKSSGFQSGDVDCYLYNSAESQVASDTSGVDMNITYTVTTPGIYYLQFYRTGAGAGTYQGEVTYPSTTYVSAPPVVSHPSDQLFEVNNPGKVIDWVITDALVFNPTYSIYQNGTLNCTKSWVSGNNTNFSLSGLPVGSYNFTIIVNDGQGFITQDTVIVTVVANLAPTITHLGDQNIALGATGKSLSWTMVDFNMPSPWYTLYRNNIEIANGTWGSSVPVSHSLDGLPAGSYSYVLAVVDGAGGAVNDSVSVSVVANLDPTITSPPDLNFTAGTPNRTITWVGTDTTILTAIYKFYVNNTLNITGTWVSGQNITFNITAFPAGKYVLKLILFDGYGPSVQDLVNLTVFASSNSMTSTSPGAGGDSDGIPGYPFEYLLGICTLSVGIILFKKRTKKKK